MSIFINFCFEFIQIKFQSSNRCICFATNASIWTHKTKSDKLLPHKWKKELKGMHNISVLYIMKFVEHFIMWSLGDTDCGQNEVLEECPADCADDYCPTKNGEASACFKPEKDECPSPVCKCQFNHRRARNGTCISTRDCRMYFIFTWLQWSYDRPKNDFFYYFDRKTTSKIRYL